LREGHTIAGTLNELAGLCMIHAQLRDRSTIRQSLNHSGQFSSGSKDFVGEYSIAFKLRERAEEVKAPKQLISYHEPRPFMNEIRSKSWKHSDHVGSN